MTAAGQVPPDRWASFDDGIREVVAALAGTTRRGSILSDVDACCAGFQEILPREAAEMGPTVEALAGNLATVLPERVEVADHENLDAHRDLTDGELLQELSERLG